MYRRQSYMMQASILILNIMFVWPFKLIRWIYRKIRDSRYNIDFSDYEYDEDDEEY